MRSLIATALSAATLVPGLAAAQQLEEVIVTAQKRAQNLQDVPISVSVHTGDTLASLGLDSVTGLVDVTPGLVMLNLGGFANPYVRGVGAVASTIGNDSPVATYIDGVYSAEKMSTAQYEFLDIERIEVLKGPQGTLFGRNATGGAINIVNRTPTEEFSGKLEATYGNFDTMNVKAYFAGSLTDNLLASIAYVHAESDGFIENGSIFPETSWDDEDLGESETDQLRAKLLWRATENLDLTLSVDYMDSLDRAGLAWLALSDQETLAEEVGFPITREPWESSQNGQPETAVENWGASLTIDWATDYFDLKSITAYRDNDISQQNDQDISSVPIFQFRQDGGFTETFQQEIQFSSNHDGAFQWLGGIFYLDDDTAYEPLDFIEATPHPITPENVALSTNGGYTSLENGRTSESWAVFGEGRYNFTDDTMLTLGLRYTEEKIELYDDRAFYFVFPLPDLSGFDRNPVATFPGGVSDSFEEPTWAIVLDHRFSDDILGYVSYKRGFKAGVYNLAGAGGDNDQATEPEIIDAYEIGVKSELMDRTLRLNAALFYYDYTDLQVQVSKITAEGGTGVVTENAAEAEIYGLDIEAQWVPTNNLSFFLGLSALDAEYKDYPNATVFLPGSPLPGLEPSTADLSGAPLPYTPDYTINLGVNYMAELGDAGSIELAANWYHSDDYELEHILLVEQDAYDRVSASATWNSPGNRFYVRVWGNNLLDEEVKTNLSSNPFGQQGTYFPPRTYGLTAGVNLGQM